jgi:hypothetical protein
MKKSEMVKNVDPGALLLARRVTPSSHVGKTFHKD